MGKPEKFFMAGTEGTGDYTVVAVTSRGRVGFREFMPGYFRVRLELNAKIDPEPAGEVHLDEVSQKRADSIAALLGPRWKRGMGGSEYRFSTVVDDQEKLEAAVALGLKAIGAPELKTIEVNKAAPEWARRLVRGNGASKGKTSSGENRGKKQDATACGDQAKR